MTLGDLEMFVSIWMCLQSPPQKKNEDTLTQSKM